MHVIIIAIEPGFRAMSMTKRQENGILTEARFPGDRITKDLNVLT